MKKLNYKGVLFDCFRKYNCEGEYEDNLTITKIEKEDSIYSYICPECAEKFNFYKETEMSKEGIIELKAQEEENYGLSITCCVDGCYNKRAIDIDFDNSHCVLIATDKRKTINALEAFMTTAYELLNEWGYDLDETESLKIYPFEKSFDEVVADIINWVNVTIKELQEGE